MAQTDIILPAYNPLLGWEETIIQRFASIQKALPQHTFRLIVINDGSAQIHNVEKLKLAISEMTWISYPVNRGKGHAVREGMKVATSDLLVYTDIDWPYTEESMIRLIQQLELGHDAVIGVRDEGYYAHLPAMRKRISKWLRSFNAALLKLKVADTQAGLKGFRQPVKEIFLATTIDRYLFDLEFVYLLSRNKDLKVTSIPIELREGIRFSRMNRKILFQEARNFLRVWLKK